MSEMEIKSRKIKKAVKVIYVFPTTIAEAVSKYGEDLVFNRFDRQIKQEFRAAVIRSMEAALKAKSNVQDAATKAAGGFSPDVRSHATRATKTISKALENLNAEERALVLAALAGESDGPPPPGNGSASHAVEGDALASE